MVGVFLVIVLVVILGVMVYLLCDKFFRLILILVVIGVGILVVGVYLLFFLNGVIGGVIVCL